MRLGTRDVATGHLTQKIKVSSAKEIGELEDAFNQMVEQIQFLTGEINRVTSCNPANNLIEGKNTLTDGYLSLPSQNTAGNLGEAGLPKGIFFIHKTLFYMSINTTDNDVKVKIIT